LLLTSAVCRSSVLGALASVALLMSATASAGWQGAPEILRMESVGDEIRVNGTPMLVRRFEASQPAGAVVAYFDHEWSNEPSAQPVKHSKLGAWTVLNQDIGDRHRSVQVRELAPGTIEGLLAVTSPVLHREPVLAVRLPLDFSIVSVVDSIDQGRAAQQIMARSHQSLTNIDHAIESELRTLGWSTPQRRKTANALLISANRGDAQFDAVINAKAGGSIGIFNIVGGSRP
jgi:hypothetical protein